MVIPLPVKADMHSKIASIMPMPVTKYRISPQIKLAHNHESEEIIIACFRRILLIEYFFNIFIHANPKIIEIRDGMRKPIALNSRYIKSTTIGTKHITPIPIIKRPIFLATINKSFLLTYLILLPDSLINYLLNELTYKFISKKYITINKRKNE